MRNQVRGPGRCKSISFSLPHPSNSKTIYSFYYQKLIFVLLAFLEMFIIAINMFYFDLIKIRFFILVLVKNFNDSEYESVKLKFLTILHLP